MNQLSSIDNPKYWTRVELIFQARTQMRIAQFSANEEEMWTTDQMLIALRNIEADVAEFFGDDE
ncbi:hypothetical protein [Polynucleobacter sphagniphilus]|uniref:hypothetical protein n=1 Tax=Polynucleobacter sphagniphilus TaxID=1743169 RepID=UPI0024075F80|nr:hypothetical protein [Polynucleobacter sphagniphilus]MDF9787214.1 hypothetical protein [Polynucleobacter sphagniphilus]